MIRQIVETRYSVKTSAVITFISIVSSVALPQLFHMIGAASGLGTAVGAAFLPMHIPVILAGLLSGCAAGSICGLFAPLVSFALSGMPTQQLLPFMMVELVGYGFAAGMLSRSSLPVIVKVLITQAAGRLLRAAAVLGAVYILGAGNIDISQVWSIIPQGLCGILLQLIFIPLFMYRLENSHE